MHMLSSHVVSVSLVWKEESRFFFFNNDNMDLMGKKKSNCNHMGRYRLFMSTKNSVWSFFFFLSPDVIGSIDLSALSIIFQLTELNFCHLLYLIYLTSTVMASTECNTGFILLSTNLDLDLRLVLYIRGEFDALMTLCHSSMLF